jgi:glycine/D-amino acid oxidase-like deaminating enzyme
MNRREYLALSAAAIAAASARQVRAQGAAGRRVVVVGGGILGAAIAYHMAQTGAKVTVLEKSKPGAGATQNSFAWLNAGGKRPRPYHVLNLLGMMGWHRLKSEMGAALPIQWGGCVEWVADAEDAAKLKASVARQQAWGYPIRSIRTEEIATLLPGVTPGPVAGAAFCDAEGQVNPSVANNALLKAAERFGAKVEYPVEVTGFDIGAGGRVTRVLTSKGAIDCDDLVLAAGLDTMPLAAKLGARVPLESSVGVLAHTDKRPLALPRLAYGPGANIKQNPEGSFVTGSSFGGTPDVAATRETGEALLAQARKYVPAIGAAKLEWVSLGHRVLPKDGVSIVGHLDSAPNVYVTAMHSGMSQAPLIGQLTAIEVLDGTKVDLIETFRPSRFA